MPPHIRAAMSDPLRRFGMAVASMYGIVAPRPATIPPASHAVASPQLQPKKSGVAKITTAAAIRSSRVPCSTDLDCELSGQCVQGGCTCDPGWSGEHCTKLALKPNEPGHYAYRHHAPDGRSFWNSWGSSQPIKDENGTYHLLATRVLNGCNVVPDYTYNEDLVHAVSDTLLGPYEFRNVAVNTTVINPTVLAAPDGMFVLFYSGEPIPAHFHKNCSSNEDKLQEPPGPPGYVNVGCVLSVATSDSWDTAFEVRAANFTPKGAEHLFCRTNPSAWIFPNGTTLLYFRSAEKDGSNEQIWLATSPHYLGPYTLHGDEPLFPVHNEDPFVFQTARGHFIMMLHKSHWGPGPNGAKAFSYDGLDWHYTEESMADVWNSTIEYIDGSAVTFHRREEPKIYVEAGQMLAMFNAVNDYRESPGTSYVMSQAIDVSPRQHNSVQQLAPSSVIV
eukprot:TRINITY_DN39736_c0_g1_i1.p1 TRINITY_DN39736_c0_g1~~TRINITY_DN39736_c0_g1_i1.p1  ORF type:complete len:446 (+),score=51.08 TRINITY_DN39736_c0_g1_i1:30-1367(+)